MDGRHRGGYDDKGIIKIIPEAEEIEKSNRDYRLCGRFAVCL